MSSKPENFPPSDGLPVKSIRFEMVAARFSDGDEVAGWPRLVYDPVFARTLPSCLFALQEREDARHRAACLRFRKEAAKLPWTYPNDL